MDQVKFKCILSVLGRHELTLREKKFVEAVKKYFDENNKLTDQQESLLEGIYREKIWMKRALLSQDNLQRAFLQELPELILLKNKRRLSW